MLSYVYDRMVHPTIRVVVHAVTFNCLKTWLHFVWKIVFKDNVPSASVTVRIFDAPSSLEPGVWEGHTLGSYQFGDLARAHSAIIKHVKNNSGYSFTVEVEAVGSKYVCSVTPPRSFFDRMLRAFSDNRFN